MFRRAETFIDYVRELEHNEGTAARFKSQQYFYR